MVIKPRIRGFICTTAHPEGCATAVQKQIDYVKSQGTLANGPKKVLIIGASTGFGLSTRITTAFACGSDTLGVFYERPADKKRTASPGWYQSVAFERAAHKEGLYAKSINGDAFSNEIKEQTIATIKEDLGQVDMVIYSLAAPRRLHPVSGKLFKSVLKPVGKSVLQKGIDVNTGIVSEVVIEPAEGDDIEQTIAVMGGEDWNMWITALKEADALAPNVLTVAYSYIGPEMTRDIYRNGTIGLAKVDLEKTANVIQKQLTELNGKAYVSVNKALVTQASAAIPVMPLYINLLYKIMAKYGIHEGCKEQIYRLFKDYILAEDSNIPVDEENRIRIDNWEFDPRVQKEVTDLFQRITTENQEQLCDLSTYKNEFLHLFGFGFDEIDYDADVENIDWQFDN